MLSQCYPDIFVRFALAPVTLDLGLGCGGSLVALFKYTNFGRFISYKLKRISLLLK